MNPPRRPSSPARLFVFLLFTSFQPAVRAQEGAEVVRVPVGGAVQVKLAEHPVANLLCDDLSIVHPEIVQHDGSWLRLFGLKQGVTLCAVNHLYIRKRLFKVIVAPATQHKHHP